MSSGEQAYSVFNLHRPGTHSATAILVLNRRRNLSAALHQKTNNISLIPYKSCLLFDILPVFDVESMAFAFISSHGPFSKTSNHTCWTLLCKERLRLRPRRELFFRYSNVIAGLAKPRQYLRLYSHQFNWGLVLNGAAAGGH